MTALRDPVLERERALSSRETVLELPRVSRPVLLFQTFGVVVASTRRRRLNPILPRCYPSKEAVLFDHTRDIESLVIDVTIDRRRKGAIVVERINFPYALVTYCTVKFGVLVMGSSSR